MIGALLALLLACEPEKTAPVNADPGPDPSPETGLPDPGEGDSVAPDDPEDSGGQSASPRVDDAWLNPTPAPIFDDTVLHTVALTLGEEARAALRDEPYVWVRGDVALDGEAVSAVGVRLRGKIGSFRTLDQKPKFKIDLNRYNPDQEFQGLEAISLNNEVVDCSYVKEPAGYAVYHAMGLAAPHTSFATVTVDGEDYGLYVLVEVPDDRFLKANFDKAKGNLYDGKYLYYGGYDYEMVDFTPSLDGNFTLEEGEDVGLADIQAITAALRSDEGDFEARLDPLVDLDQLHRLLAVEQWIGHVDGYALDQNNYRVYMNPYDDRAEIIPWDLDYAFTSPRSWGMSWSEPRGALARGCWADEACFAAQAETARAAVERIDTDALLARFDAWTALIASAAAADPRRECGAARVAPSQEDVRAWLESRPESVPAWWEGR